MLFDYKTLASNFSPLIINSKDEVVERMNDIIEVKREELRELNDKIRVEKENFVLDAIWNILNDIDEIIKYRVENITISKESDTLEDVDTKISYTYEFNPSETIFTSIDDTKEIVTTISKVIMEVMVEKGYMNDENKGVYIGIGGDKPNYISVDFDLY